MSGQADAPDLSHTPVVQPPPGVTSNFVNPINHKAQAYAQHVTLCIAITIALTLRLYTRAWVLKRKLGIDDYLITLAWMLAVSYSAVFLASIEKGGGRHLWDIPMTMLVPALKDQFVIELLYMPLTLSIKLSMLICYLNIFHRRGLGTRIPIWFGIFAVSIFYTVLFFTTVTYCTPIKRAYNPFIEGHCRPFATAAFASGYFNVFSDFYILALPLPDVWGLRMSGGRKARLIAIFGLGLFTCVASIMRLVWTYQHVNDTDTLWSFVKTGYWPTLEVDIGIICACALVFPALFKSENRRSLGYLGKWVRSYLSSGSRNTASDPSRYMKESKDTKDSKGTWGSSKMDRTITRVDDYEIELLDVGSLAAREASRSFIVEPPEAYHPRPARDAHMV